MSKALINRSITTVKTELEFLLDSNVIDQNFYDTVVKSLPAKYVENAAPCSLSSESVAKTAAAPVEAAAPPAQAPPAQAPPSYAYSAPAEYVEAIYEFGAQRAEDLPLRVGDQVKVIEKPNEHWYKGECNGRTGMFPANYVKPCDNKGYGEKSGYFNAPPQQVQPVHNQQVQQQQPQQVFPPAQEQSSGGGHFKKFGKKFGDAAIFGAGATVGGEIIHSIF